MSLGSFSGRGVDASGSDGGEVDGRGMDRRGGAL